MKLGVVILVLSLLLISIGGVLAETTTAVGALKALGRDRGEAFRENVIQVIGVGGVDQPPVWRIITKDPFQAGAIRDFAVENGRVVGDQFVPPAYHSRVPASVLRDEVLRMDSKAVFLIANERAKLAKVGFYTLDYEVRSTDGGKGIWIVRLNGADRGRVGELILGAADGAVLRERWWPAGSVRATGPVPSGKAIRNDGAGADSESIGVQIADGWVRAKRGLSQGKNEIKKNAEQAGRSVQTFFRDVFAAKSGGGGGRPVSRTEPRFGYRSPEPAEATMDAGRYH